MRGILCLFLVGEAVSYYCTQQYVKLEMTEKPEILLYQTEDGQTKVEVRLENETVWLTQALMVELFQTTKQNISLHIQNILRKVNCRKFQLSRNP